MSRPSPRSVSDDPQAAWTFLTHPNDAAFEGQHFDTCVEEMTFNDYLSLLRYKGTWEKFATAFRLRTESPDSPPSQCNPLVNGQD